MTEKPIHIAYDASCLIPQPLTGVGYYTLHLLETLIKTQPGIALHLFANSAQAVSPTFRELGAQSQSARFVRCPTRLKNLLWTRTGMPAIENFTGAADIAHGGFSLLPASRTPRRVVTVFDLSGVHKPNTRSSENLDMHMRLLRQAAKHATAFIAISESCKKDVVEILGVSPDNVHVVYGGVHLEEFEGEINAPHLEELKKHFAITRPYFIHLGTLEPRKNLPRLLNAYSCVRERNAGLPQLVLAGKKGWMYDDIFDTIAQLKLEKDVIFTDYLLRKDAVSLLKGAYACVYPSLYEGFGLPVLEAMAARVPILTSNLSSLPEVAGDTALLVNPESQDEIEAGLEILLNDYPAVQQRTEAAYARAGQFSWDASAQSLAQVYRQLMEAGA